MLNQTLMRAISVLTAVVMIPFYGLTYLIDAFSAGTRTEVYHTNVVGPGAYFRSQGIACDEEGYLYFSSKTTLYKTGADGRTFVAANFAAIPEELKAIGIKHIGGLSYCSGFLYAGLEDSKVWQHPIVGVFDAETLQMVKWYALDSTVHTRGLPWVTVEPTSKYLYTFDHSKQPTAILIYDITADMAMVKRVPLAQMIPSVQGAEFRNGTLYVATNDETQAVYGVDVASGTSHKIFDRGLTAGSEGEGMTFVNRDGKVYLLAMDMGPLFINANLRWYELPSQTA